jgi:hypothetical protein
MKNRYGGDGMTFEAEVDTSNGKIVVGDIYDDEADTVPAKSKNSNDFDNVDKKMLSNKFFELNS